MRVIDIIVRKRDGHALTRSEIRFVIAGAADGTIPDYQVAALLMAMFVRGMTDDETAWLTEAMVDSGRRADLSWLPGIKVGKHSTGGVGDKTSIVVVPTVAACGVIVPKSSGRALGHTGGTLDKLASIPGFRHQLQPDEIRAALQELGCVFVSQSAELAPADKKLYELRDVTGTVESIPLIASSIMSKKIAEGTDALVLDVKVGAGGFMKTLTEATALAETMVGIGARVSLRTEALITSMDAPLGHCIGNALEIRECIDTLNGRGPTDLERLCIALAARMLRAGGGAATIEDGEARARDALTSGRALERFRHVVERQGGDARVIDHPERLPRARTVETVAADRAGFIRELRADRVGLASMMLGAGRERLDQDIDPAAGIVLRAAPGDRVDRGDPIADLHSDGVTRVAAARTLFASAVVIDDAPPAPRATVISVVALNT